MSSDSSPSDNILKYLKFSNLTKMSIIFPIGKDQVPVTKSAVTALLLCMC